MQVFLSSFLHRSRAISIPNSPSPVLLPNPAPATSLAYELNATARRHGTNLTSTERQELLAAAKNLVAELEDPEEAVWRLCMMPCGHAALRSAREMGIFDAWDSETKAVTSEELALKLGASRVLIVRIMRSLITIGVFAEKGRENYVHNKLSRQLSTPPFSTLVSGVMDRLLEPMQALPEYLKSINYQNPGDPEETPSLFQYTYNTDKDFFDWIHERPEALAAFKRVMADFSALERSKLDRGLSSIFPFEKVLGRNVSGSEAALVDVGGGRGQLVEDIRKFLPNFQGRLVLQDLPQTLSSSPPLDAVEKMPYNFFEQPQPIKGAHAYFFRHILHDWPDRKVRQILLNTIPALVKGRSRILIADMVLADTKAWYYGTLWDINMMRFSGMERSRSHWQKLLASVGLRVVRIWPKVNLDHVIEAVPVDWER